MRHIYLLPPATKLWQGNVFTPVCHSVHREGCVCLWSWGGVCRLLGRHSLGRPPPGQTPPGRHPPGQTPSWAEPPWADTPHADTPGQISPGQTPPRQTQCMLGYGQRAGSMHPSEMHSCLPQENTMSLYDVDTEVALCFKDFYTTKFLFLPLN